MRQRKQGGPRRLHDTRRPARTRQEETSARVVWVACFCFVAFVVSVVLPKRDNDDANDLLAVLQQHSSGLLVRDDTKHQDTNTQEDIDVPPPQPPANTDAKASSSSELLPPLRVNVSHTTLAHLATLPDFPKIVHYVWSNKSVVDNVQHYMVQYGVRQMIDLNPDWTVIVHEYADVNRVIEEFHHEDLSDRMKQAILGGHLVERTDTFRFMILYTVGGLYIDMDRVVSKRLSEVIDVKRHKLVVPTYYNINFCMDLVGSSPGNRVLLQVLRQSWKKRLGPPTLPRKHGWLKKWDQMQIVDSFTTTVERELFGRTLMDGGDESLYDDARRAIHEQSRGLILTAKDEWCDGLVVHNFEMCKKVSRNPFYEAWNVTRWGDEVEAVWGEDQEPTK